MNILKTSGSSSRHPTPWRSLPGHRPGACFALCFTLGGALLCHGYFESKQPQEELPPPTPPSAEELRDPRILLVYDEQAISDRERAALSALVPSTVPLDNWPEVPAQKGESIWKVVKDYFFFWGKDHPNTSRTLVTQIQRANGLEDDVIPEDRTLKIPPLPVRGYSQYPRGEADVRTFRPMTHGYGRTAQVGDLYFSDSPRIAKYEDLSEEREGNLTLVEIDTSARGPEYAFVSAPLGESSNFQFYSPRGYVELELLDSNPLPCEPAEDWLSTSPYLPLLRQKLSALSQASIGAIAQRARQKPLVLLDWDFDPAHQGHGSKVLSAAKFLLSSMPELAFLAGSIEKIDLYPRGPEQKKLLRDLLKEAENSGAFGGPGTLEFFEAWGKEAKRWIAHPVVDPSGNKFAVPEFLIKAAFWKLAARPVWANVSLTVYSPIFENVPPRFTRELNSFASLAAGNSRLPLAPQSAPQHSGSHARNAVNVSYGNRSGEIFGTIGDAERNTVVAVLGPGCGFQFGTLTPSERGSSFASPYVAMAAWLKYLLDSTDPRAMRRSLILASDLRPALDPAIQSSGLFDPARLLAYPGPHFVTLAGTVVRLQSVESIEVSYLKGDSETIRRQWSSADPRASRTMVVAKDGSGFRLWIREVSSDAFPVVEISSGLLQTLSLRLVTSDNQTLVLNSPQEFIENIRETSF